MHHEKTTRAWDRITIATVFWKLRMGPISGKQYLFAKSESAGLGLQCIESMAKACFITSTIANGLCARDEETRVIFEENYQKQEETNITIVKNIMKEDEN